MIPFFICILQFMILSVSVPYQKFGPLCSILLGHYQIGPLLITCSQVVAIIYAVYFCLLPLDSLDNNLFCLSSLAPQTVSGGPPSYICRLSGKSDVDWSFWLEVMIICPASKPMGITARLFFIDVWISISSYVYMHSCPKYRKLSH